MEKQKKKLPVGIENFKELQREGFYYVDKTNLIKELLAGWAKVNLFTRPRRFGKSLNMSMLKSFFEIGTDKELFQNLNIAKETVLCEELSRPRQHRHLKRKNSILFLVFLDFPHFFIHSGWQDTLF